LRTGALEQVIVARTATANTLEPSFIDTPPSVRSEPEAPRKSGFTSLSRPAQIYVVGITLWGAVALLRAVTGVDPYQPMFIILLAAACLISAWKITLPLPVANGSTLSMADAANVMSMLLLGASASAVVAAAGVWVQCTHRPKQRYPLYRTLFSMASASLTMLGTGAAYSALGGHGVPADMLAVFAEPVVGALATYFVVNTTLVAGAIALSTGRGFIETWQDDFLWSASSFMVAGAAGALGAVVVARGEHWKVALLLAPVYLTYRTYLAFVGRLDSEQRHTEEVRALHEQAMQALHQAREAERALAGEKERLAAALARMTRLEELRHELLDREQASRAAAETANRVKDQFLAVVSHELRTPLNAILGWADMLCRGKLDGERRERAALTIRDSARRQAQLIDDLLDVARITSGKLRLQRAIIELSDVISDALQVVQPVAEAKSVRILIEFAAPVDPLYGDAARLQQVIWNLLSNAVKFTPGGGSVTVGVRQTGHSAEVRVEDTGQGIEPDFLPLIFEPFRQADASSTRAHPGLGLGLAIVKTLVEAHGGNITASSAGPGKGASFVLRLPTAGLTGAEAPATPERPPVVESHEVDQELHGVAILLVDDEADSREVVAAQLLGSGAQVKTADSAAAALDLMQQEHFDVLVADIGMPGEDGYSLIRRVRALPISAAASVPAAALTALARKEDRQQALQAGFQMHLTKPVDARTLVATVATLHRLNAT
jgi:signal transduction histidine kinase/ActR/RegA family two-component response regulator